MDIKRNDIIEYINGYEVDEQDLEILKHELYGVYTVDGDENKKYVIDLNVESIVKENISNQKVYNERKEKLKGLKQLKLPEQRSPEWYEMRKDKLTASSLASAIGKCHFTTREELILSKIEDKPYVSNPITEWGVKYEDIAILFYEELYNVKVLDFGLIPHPTFKAFGASPDGICDDTGNDEYVARMVEIKCPPKRKFTKTCPPHYLMQVQGQLEVCDLDHCDFFQVKIEDYENYEEYEKDIFVNDDVILPGRTNLNYPKGVTVSYRKKNEIKLTYLYPVLNMSDDEYKEWIREKKIEIIEGGHEFVESKWWKISRYECTFIQRNYQWWNENVEHILKFYTDMKMYKSSPEKVSELKAEIAKKKKRNVKEVPLDEFMLISDEEDN
jgi:putative phage-type endonuclease